MYSLPPHSVFNAIAALRDRLARWLPGRARETYGPQETHCAVTLGPLHISTTDCHVLDHADAEVRLSLRFPRLPCLPLPWAELAAGYRVCLGEETVRPAGWFRHVWRPLPPVVYGAGREGEEPVPF